MSEKISQLTASTGAVLTDLTETSQVAGMSFNTVKTTESQRLTLFNSLLSGATVYTHSTTPLVLTNPLPTVLNITLTSASTVQLPAINAQIPAWKGRNFFIYNGGSLSSNAPFQVVAQDGSTVISPRIEIGQMVLFFVQDDSTANGTYISTLIPNNYITRRIVNGGNFGTDIPISQFLYNVIEASSPSAFTASTIGVNNVNTGSNFFLKNNSTGAVTFTPTSPQTIDGAAVLTLNPNESAWILVGSTQFETISWSKVNTQGVANERITSLASDGFTLADVNLITGCGTISFTHSGAATCNIPLNATIPIPIGAKIRVYNATVALTFTVTAGVTVTPFLPSVVTGFYSYEFEKINTDIWLVTNYISSSTITIPALTGDVTTTGTTNVTTLATVATPGVIGTSQQFPQITVNAKGLITSYTNLYPAVSTRNSSLASETIASTDQNGMIVMGHSGGGTVTINSSILPVGSFFSVYNDFVKTAASVTVAAGAGVSILPANPTITSAYGLTLFQTDVDKWRIISCDQNNAKFTGGTVDNMAIGGATPSTAIFTTLRASSGINNTTIGATTPSTGAFTTLSASSGLDSTVIGGVTPSTVAATTMTATSILFGGSNQTSLSVCEFGSYATTFTWGSATSASVTINFFRIGRLVVIMVPSFSITNSSPQVSTVNANTNAATRLIPSATQIVAQDYQNPSGTIPGVGRYVFSSLGTIIIQGVNGTNISSSVGFVSEPTSFTFFV
jgi:hypothetical protein